jgi:hypothetical protein
MNFCLSYLSGHLGGRRVPAYPTWFTRAANYAIKNIRVCVLVQCTHTYIVIMHTCDIIHTYMRWLLQAKLMGPPSRSSSSVVGRCLCCTIFRSCHPRTINAHVTACSKKFEESSVCARHRHPQAAVSW